MHVFAINTLSEGEEIGRIAAPYMPPMQRDTPSDGFPFGWKPQATNDTPQPVIGGRRWHRSVAAGASSGPGWLTIGN